MAEFKLGRIKFVWKDAWTVGQTYYKDDIVRYGGKTYLCVVGHIANTDFYTDLDNVPTKWNQVSDGQVWKNDWLTSTYYKINDLVKYGAFVYICKEGHTSAGTTTLGLEQDSDKWDLFAESFAFIGNWTPLTRYRLNDIVKYGGNTYLCNNDHTSASTESLGLEPNFSDWTLYTEGFDWKTDWTVDTRYKINDVVKYGGTTYVCNFGHSSAATTTLGLEDDQAYWDYMHKGTEYKGAWSNATVRYKINDVVKYGSGIWICTIYHSSAVATTFEADATAGRWAQYVEGLEFEDSWASSIIYQPGDIATYGGYAYISKTNHTSAALSPPSTNTTDWDLYTTSIKFQGEWSSVSGYKVGDIVRLGGYTYVAVVDNTNQTPPNLSYWDRLNSGIRWKGQWLDDFEYELGDAVRYGTSSYICILSHISEGDDYSSLTSGSANSRPDQDVTGTYWNLLSSGSEESVLTTTGDLVYYTGVGPNRLPVGEEGQILRVGSSGVPEWAFYGVVSKLVYVAPHGVDAPAPGYGLTLDRPWASVRYATDQINNGYDNPNAKQLLQLNRTFIQSEVAEWVDYQIGVGTGIWAAFTNDNKDKCIRDVGLLVDALAYDISHTGNVKTRELTLTYFDTNGNLIASLNDEKAQGVAAIGYALVLMDRILRNQAPVANYQALNSVADPVLQYIDVTYTSETGVMDTITALTTIVTDALTAGTNTNVPVAETPGWTINIKTGQYYEVLPIIVPAGTALVGDELRSTKINPEVKLIADNDKAKSIAVLTHLRSITDEIIQNIAVTPTSGNTAIQNRTGQRAGSIGSTTALNSVIANAAEIKDIITNNTPNAYVYPAPTNWGTTLVNTAYAAGGFVTGDTSGFDDGRRLIIANKTMIVDEVSAWIDAQIAVAAPPFATFVYAGANRTKCERDVGYIVDALVYDLTYGGNLATEIAARSYYSLGVFVEGNEKTQLLAVLTRIKSFIDNVAIGNTAGWAKTTVTAQDVSGTPGSADSAAFAQDRIQEIYDTVNTGTDPTTILPYTAWVSAELLAARTAINDVKAEIQSDGVQFVKRHFPTLNFDTVLCSRDVGYMVDALGYDLMFGSNFLSIQGGLAYQRGLSSTNLVITTQLEAQQAIVDFIGLKVSEIATSGAVVFADLLWSYILGIVNTGTIPVNTGRNIPSTSLDMLNGAQILRLNANFMAAEAVAYTANTYKTTVSASTGGATDVFTCSSQTWLVAGDTIRFTGTVFGGVSTNTTYYVLASGLTATSFKVSLTLNGTAVDLSTTTGSMIASWYYNSARCQNDVVNYVNSIADDMTYTGNYKVVLASRYYRNALTGSKLEDMFLVRNGCGIRNMTLRGLDGTSDGNTAGAIDADGLTDNNAFGTKRPLAGAYVSLDPGWGPNDTKVWITTRSTYVQNITVFGQSCTGQKIDGALHAGGNDSIVSNDFTKVIDDGIGAWVTNLGRAELVSVFTYYNHIGYLSENGGKIRATNGNNSYGDFGSVAEGVDVTEVAVTGTVNNYGFEAQIGNVFTDGDRILSFEYTNAGVGYSDGTYTISGAGSNAAAFQDEFRDGGTFEVRLTDPGDSSGPGGSGYITAGNIAQAGTTTQITLAATDTRSSLAYVGMAIYIIAGTGAGQYGYITAYNALTKIATVSKESDGTSGWDHIIPGTTIAAALDLTTFYEITPRLAFSTPTYSFATATNDLPTSDVWSDIVYGAGVGSYTAVIASGGSGSGAKFDITRREGVYTVTQNVLGLGLGYTVGNTLTIAGTALGGASPANNITITVTAVDTTNANSVDAFTYTGTAISQQYVAVSTTSSSVAATSTNGVTWVQRALDATADWTSVTYGTISGVGYYVAVASGSTVASYSINGIDWVAMTGLPSGVWTSVTYGNGRFVAVATGGTISAYSTNGTSWVAMTGLPSASWNGVTYGAGIFVAVAGGGTVAASSANGTSWTSRTVPSGAYTDVTYGKGRFVALVPSSASGAYSLNGTTWTAMTQVNRAWTRVTYGNGVFLGVASTSYACTSEDGINWTEQTSIPASAVTYGNPGGAVQFISVKNGTNDTTTMKFGAKTRARSFVDNNLITQIWVTEPGGAYTVAPTLTITDPNNVGADATTTVRIGNGVLASPTFTNRGTGYSSADATVSGTGYADSYQTGTFINVSGLTLEPEPGANLQIAGIDDVYYRLVQVTQFLGSLPGEYSARLQISPPLNELESPEHGASITLRRRYSQVRLTGHDFLDIGTGNTTQSNYPGLPLQDKIPANETVDSDGGRVFYTSTDQDGNFRVGGLFNVEQATGVATLNADAFNIAGLNELQLGSVALDGAGAVISEFSTDPFFTADSDNIVPTQRAIKAYIASQIGGGGSSINVNSLTAGVIYISGNSITTTTNVQIDINTKMNFTAGVDGSPVALNYFLLG